ncbi:UNVERIFIED_CONTAM: hypothetical protein GTU68_023173 [Idotea baltica]|nr:hypothetical protein [Idotea baltica]
MEPLELTVSGLARSLGVSRKTVSKIANEGAGVSAEMALRLSRAFNTSPELWLNLQRNYDLWHAAQESDEWESVEPVAA